MSAGQEEKQKKDSLKMHTLFLQWTANGRVHRRTRQYNKNMTAPKVKQTL